MLLHHELCEVQLGDFLRVGDLEFEFLVIRINKLMEPLVRRFHVIDTVQEILGTDINQDAFDSHTLHRVATLLPFNQVVNAQDRPLLINTHLSKT